jgi:hypothetical protein
LRHAARLQAKVELGLAQPRSHSSDRRHSPANQTLFKRLIAEEKRELQKQARVNNDQSVSRPVVSNVPKPVEPPVESMEVDPPVPAAEAAAPVAPAAEAPAPAPAASKPAEPPKLPVPDVEFIDAETDAAVRSILSGTDMNVISPIKSPRKSRKSFAEAAGDFPPIPKRKSKGSSQSKLTPLPGKTRPSEGKAKP